MNDAEWKAWTLHHATMHRMTADEDVAMLDSWRDAFEARGYSQPELRAASLKLAETDPRRWRSEHLEFLLSHVAAARMARARAEREEEDRRHAEDRCRLCGNSGIVTVPHTRSVVNGEWLHPYYACGVACVCYRGKRKVTDHERSRLAAEEAAQRGKGRPVPALMAMEDYDRHNPSWELQMQTRDVKRSSERRAREEAAYHDKKRGPMLIGGAVRALIERQPGEHDAQP